MDQDAAQVTPGPDRRDDMDTGSNGLDPPDWPPNCPSREALDFLELALTSGIPNASHGDRPQSPVTSEGSRPENLTITLPLGGTLFARPSLNMFTSQAPEDSNQEPELGSLSFDDLSLMVVDEVRDALLSPPDQHIPDAVTNTTNDRCLLLGLPRPRPAMPPLRLQPNGVLRLDCSIHSPLSSPTTGMAGVGQQTSDGPNGSQSTNRPQMRQSEADSEPPGVFEAPPKRKRIIKIKSREAVLYLREMKKREEAEVNVQRRIERGEVRPPTETAQSDEAAWHWDTGFEVPGDNASLEKSR